MRVLHIGKFYPPFAGGIEYFLADLLPALQEFGVQTAALVHHHEARRSEQPVTDGRLDSMPLVYRAPYYGSLLYAPLSPQFPLWLKRAIRSFKPDILHLHVPNTSAFWAMALPAARALPWVIHWHADVVASRIDRRLALAYGVYRPFEQALLANTSAVIASSPPYLDSSAALMNWRSKCRVIPLGLNPDRIPDPDPEALNRAEQIWQDAPYRLLAVGRLTYYKGHEVLLRAVKQVPNCRLLIVGKGEQRPRLDALIDQLGLNDSAALIGFQAEPELHALLASCDVVCLPSLERTEAFGLVLLEAMRFGKPVVASDIPGSGVGWVVRQGGHGLLVEPGDANALAQALAVLAEPGKRNELGKRGAAALHDIFHIKQVAKQTLALYESLQRASGRPES